MKKLTKILLLFNICFLFINCTKEKKENTLPIVSTTINADGKKEVYTVRNFHFTNQLGETFTNENTQGKVYLANFFFTSCPTICPPMRDVLVDISNSFNNFDDFMIVSFTIDPKHDTVSKLYDYSKKTGVSNQKWFLLRGTNTELKKMATFFRTHFKMNKDGTDFYHSSFVALVDKQQQIRGYYNLLDAKSVKQLKTDIKIIL